MPTTYIDLGLAQPVTLGRLALNPPLRTIRRDDGAEEIVEPRVMQVLLALIEARGGIVRREELTERCWKGRIVGEDAINHGRNSHFGHHSIGKYSKAGTAAHSLR